MLKMKDARTREDGGKRYLEGYFAVFNEEYKVWDGWSETIAPGAFARYLAEGKDTKVLWNHDSNIVLGSTGNGTASLREDETGLFGTVEINEKDQDAVNAHARVDRGDVDGCSFGFDIARQEEWWDEAGIYHTRITEVDPLYEVSPCTFPAYEATSISARSGQKFEEARQRSKEAKERELDTWKQEIRKKLKGEA
jgi:HK97 family phage prohead protease